MPSWQWIAFVAGILVAAFFSSAETALTTLGEARIRSLVETGGRRAALLRLWLNHPDRILAALLLGNTLVNVGLGSLTALMAEEAGYGHGLAVLTGVTTVILLLFGPSQIPKMARGFGQAIREFKKAQREIGDELEREPPPATKSNENKPIQ